MTPPDNQDWEDILPGGGSTGTGSENGSAKRAETGPVNSPFTVARPVDGYAFTDSPESPELRYKRLPQVEVPVPRRREPPKRIGDQVPRSGVWQPGGSARIEPKQVRTSRPSVVKAMLSGLVPLLLLAGGVYLVIRLYQ
jgi:hypothetical protein